MKGITAELLVFGGGVQLQCSMRHQLVPANTHNISRRELIKGTLCCLSSPQTSAQRKNYII